MILYPPTSPTAISNFLLNPPRPKPLPPPPEPGLVLGHRPDGKPLIWPDSERFSTHGHLLGASGYGKSRAIQSYVAQDIMRGHGVAVIDPAGDVFRLCLGYCIQGKIDPSRIVIIDPMRGDDWVMKLNPLEAQDGLGSGSNLAMESLIRTAGDRDLKHTPRVGRYLLRALRALEEAGEGLSLLTDFVATDGSGASFRQQILEKVTDRYVRQEWELFDSKLMSHARRMDAIDSSVNRVTPFVEDSRIRSMLAYPTGNLNFQTLMDEGKILLVHLGARGGRAMSRRSRQLVGCLVMQGLRSAAVRRENPRPFICYCDEFGEYVTDDFAEDLDTMRKHGLFYMLSHQRIEQIELESKNVMSSVMTNAKLKLCFGGLSKVDADRMEGEMFTGEHDMMEVKYETQATAFRPVQTWVDIKTEGEGHSTSSGTASGSIHGSVAGAATMFGTEGMIFCGPSSTGSSESSSDSNVMSDSYFSGSSDSFSTSVTRAPITVYQEFLQPASKEFFSLEEQREKKISLLMCQYPREVAVKRANKHVELIETINVPDHNLPDGAMESYAQACWSKCDHAVRGKQAQAELDARLAHYYLIEPAEVFDVEFTEVIPQASRLTDEGSIPTASAPSRVDLGPAPAEPVQDPSRSDTPETDASQSSDASTPGDTIVSYAQENPVPVKRGRGRPKKVPLPPPSDLIL